MEELLLQFVSVMVVSLLIVPGIGGALLRRAFLIAGISQFPLRKCWKVYLAACCYAYVVLMGMRLFGRYEATSLDPLMGAIIFLSITTLVIPLLLRDNTRRVLVVEAIAVPIIGAIVIALVFVLLQAA
jgi:hypothetical protein